MVAAQLLWFIFINYLVKVELKGKVNFIKHFFWWFVNSNSSSKQI